MSYGTIEAILDRDAWKQRAEAAESKLAAAEARLVECEELLRRWAEIAKLRGDAGKGGGE